MRAAISLLVLLLSMCGVQTENTQTEVQTESQDTGTAAAAAAEVSTQLDVSAELKELRDMVVELRVMLRYTQEDVKVLEAEVEVLESDNVAMKQRLSVSETDNIAMKQRLAVSESKVEALEAENVAVQQRLAASETEVENLEKEIRVAPKVAFSAGLTDSGNIGSGSNDLNLVFKKVITSVGEAYSSTTGFFTAPVRGVYYFRFTVLDWLSSRYMDIKMYKNGQQLMFLWDYDNDGQASYLSSGLTLQLEKGDLVNMVLPAGRRLYDDPNNYCTFSGFLLFPL
ncbi:complement C1q-like protein 2 [Engraulis encrasicolus]|uniref:complement C1q-like protein 2 n=1 Tax=Engraulis encrasicolus TaxID=184585 RepID=UPI002FD2BB1D